MEKEKIIGENVINLKRYLSEDKEKVITELSLNDKAIALLREFAVLNEEPIPEDYSKELRFMRYKVRTVLHRSFGDNSCFFLFNKELLDRGMVKFSHENLQRANRIMERAIYFKNTITQAGELLYNHNVTINVNIREGRA